MKNGLNRTRRGDSLLEILGIVTCIAILAVIGVVANSGRAVKAKSAQAAAEVEALAKAEIAVADHTGVYVPLQVLDDPKRGSGESARGVDDITAEPDAIKAVETGLAATSKPGDQPALGAAVKGKWQGPYHEFRRTYVGGAKGETVDQVVRRDWPLDPWGTPYRFYSPLGVIGTDAATTTTASMNNDTFGDGKLATADDRFDSYAIVSFGPDGQTDSASNGNDDVIYLFPAAGAK